MSEGIECPRCEGTGRAKAPRTTVGRVSTYNSPGDPSCDKCGGSGRLYPVVIELKPATITAEAQSG